MVAPEQLSAAVGGPRGLVESALPATVFLIGFVLVDGIRRPLIAAVVVAAVLIAVRLVQRTTPKHAAGSILGIGFGAFIASRTGHSQDVYLPGILINAAFLTAFLVSLVVRWPLLGLGFGPLLAPESPMAWRSDKVLLRAFTLASWLWVAGYALRLVVMVPLYAMGATGALGAMKLILGYPVYALTLWLSWRLLTSARPHHPEPELSATPSATPDAAGSSHPTG